MAKRRRPWTHRMFAAAACLVLAVGGCGGKDQLRAEQGSTHLRVALFPGGSTLPAHAAMIDGVCDRHGLEVELTEGTDLPLFMAGLTKGQYDIAMSVPTLALVGAEKRLDVKIIASLQRQSAEHPNAVWITRDPTITSLAALEGKTIAVPSLTGIITDALVYLLKREGIERDDVKLVQTPFPTMGDQLQAGHVDAAVATIPFYSAIVARGFTAHSDVIVEAVKAASDGTVDTAITSVWLTSGAFAREHPETIVAWRDSLSEAIGDLNADVARARTLTESWLHIPEEVVTRSPLPDWSIDITPDELMPYVEISRAVGSTRTDPDLNSLVWQGP